MLATIAPPHLSRLRRLAHPFVQNNAPFNWVMGLQTAIPMAAPLLGSHIFGWSLLDASAAMVGAILVGSGAPMLTSRNRPVWYAVMIGLVTALFWAWLQIPHTLGWHIPVGMMAAVLWVTAFVLAGTPLMAPLATGGFMMVLYYMLPVTPDATKFVFAGAVGSALFAMAVDLIAPKPVPAQTTLASLVDQLARIYSAISRPTVDEQELHGLIKAARAMQQQAIAIERNTHLPITERKLAKAVSAALDNSAILIEIRLLPTRGMVAPASMIVPELERVGNQLSAQAQVLRNGGTPDLSRLPRLSSAAPSDYSLAEFSDLRAASDRLVTELQAWSSEANAPVNPPSILQRLRTGYAPGSLMRLHLARFVVAMGIAGVISWYLGEDSAFWKDSHWLALGLFVAIQPGFSATVVKGLQRAVGSLIGGAFAFLLVALLPEHFWMGYLLPVLAFIGIGFTMTNYSWMVVAITPIVVIGFGNVDMHYDALGARVLFTSAGCLIAIVARAVLWPSWKRDELPEIASAALAAQTEFFKQLKASVATEQPSPELARGLLASGRAARQTLDALAEAQKHMLTEPLASAGKEIEEMIPLLEELRRMSFGLSIRARELGAGEQQRMEANLDVIERSLAEATSRIEAIAAEGKTQTSPVFENRRSRSGLARDRIARVESEIASLAPVARLLRDRVDALKHEGAIEPIGA